MAIRDVKEYYYTMLVQYLEEKQNLSDFEEALRDGHITEDQMVEAMDIVAKLEENYHRLAYVMYLFDIPNRKNKRTRYLKQMEPIVQEFKRLNADLPSVQLENADVLAHFKAKLAKLRQTNIKDE